MTHIKIQSTLRCEDFNMADVSTSSSIDESVVALPSAATINERNVRLLLPPSVKLPYRIQEVKFDSRGGTTAHEAEICPPCDVKLRLKTTSVDDLNEWLREFSAHTRTEYIINCK